MKLESYGMSNVGMKRMQNEDAYLINDEIGLYMVADGMGGHVGGEFASKMAVVTVEEVLKTLRQDPDATQIHGVNTQGANPGDQLRHAITEAGRKIHQQALYDESLRGMGTTAVAILCEQDKLYIANVGDSRTYLLRDNQITQLTEDHSLVTEQIKAGMIKPDEARSHKLKNIITRSVGYQEEVDTDVKEFTPQPGDQLLMCSDGLSNLLEDQEILSIVSSHELSEVCETLINQANRRGGDDNITVVFLQVDEIS